VRRGLERRWCDATDLVRIRLELHQQQFRCMRLF
jgi:hypothetical protein